MGLFSVDFVLPPSPATVKEKERLPHEANVDRRNWREEPCPGREGKQRPG